MSYFSALKKPTYHPILQQEVFKLIELTLSFYFSALKKPTYHPILQQEVDRVV